MVEVRNQKGTTVQVPRSHVGSSKKLKELILGAGFVPLQLEINML